MRHSHRGQPKVHPRHVFKAVAVNTWRLRGGWSRAWDASHEAYAPCGWWSEAPANRAADDILSPS